MNLLFSIDRGFVSRFLICARSVLRSGGADRYDFYILHSDLTEDDRETIRHALSPEAECHFVPVDPDLFAGFPTYDRYPLQIYYRIAAPLLLPASLDRILYLDADTLVINSLMPLYGTPFEGNYLMACTHTRELLRKFNQARLGVEQEVPYLNSGVMLMDLAALRKNLSLEEVRDYAGRRKRSLWLPDQDILTALYGHKVKLLDAMVYNLSDRTLSLHNADPKNEPVDLDWVRKNTVIIHYFGKNKPWKDHYRGVLDVFYREALT